MPEHTFYNVLQSYIGDKRVSFPCLYSSYDLISFHLSHQFIDNKREYPSLSTALATEVHFDLYRNVYNSFLGLNFALNFHLSFHVKFYSAMLIVDELKPSTTMPKLQITHTKQRHEGFHFVQCSYKLVALCKVFILSSLFASGSANFYNISSDSFEAFNSQRALDNVLQKYAFRAFIHPKTGIIYDAQVPNNMSGVQVHAVRLRSGSLRSRGIVYNEFDIPKGVVVQPYVERLVLVYQNLGNWSSLYYNNHGTNLQFKLVAPVLGLLAYNKSSSDRSSENLQETHILATEKPIKVRFTSVYSNKGLELGLGVAPSCIFFHLNGSVSLSNMSSSYVCTTYYQGHFSLAIQSLHLAPIPSSPSSKKVPNSIPYVKFQEKHESNAWKFALGSLLGGSMVLGVTGVFGFCLHKRRQKSMITRMEHRADQGEALQTALIGQTRAPTASGLRTHPKLENENIT